ncbi:hypothetical protein C8Q80DRAFT_1120547 [Daedaleopsis nitida]|nr:hypothetical protein C8Q80DRAFT_1120547 [Daedaleopsis nitida]
MGNSASSGRGHHDETVDFGYLTPQGIYTGPRDWNQAVVTQLIVERKLAPFYRPLEDYDESWDDEQVLAARKEPPEPEGGERAESASSASSRGHHAKRPSAAKEPARHPEAAIYRGAMECPICFLYYPPNINRSRCCDQAICTECFVQIKRVEPTTTHVVSEPAACPYCVQENFGVVYTPPPWRTGINSEGATPPSWPDSPKATSDSAASPSMKRRRKSFSHNAPEVVTVDQIHPDWEAKLEAVRAAVARRANRRIIMRQVGDRLIPVGVTSGRVHTISTDASGTENAEGSGDRGSRRRRRQQNQELNQFLGAMGLGGQDLEEIMVMEAMRLSLLEHEAQQKRQKEEEEKKQRDEAAATATGGATESQTTGGSEGTDISQATVSGPSSDESPAPLQSTDDGTPVPHTRTSDSSQPHTSSPRLSGLLPPPSELVTGSSQSGRHSGRSTPSSQYGVISAAVLSATSTASAVASPSPEHEQSNPLAESENAGEGDSEPVSASTAEGETRPDTPLPVIPTEEPTISEPSSNDHTTDRPAIAHPPSFASSVSPSYDVLPSSPESSVSDKPLLDTAALPTPSTEGESSTTTAD